MRFLVDENLSLQLCDHLVALGHDTEHVHDATGRGTSDQEIIDYAAARGAIITTADRGNHLSGPDPVPPRQ